MACAILGIMSDISAQKKAFQKGYNLLNSAQKQAVDTIDGPVMVIAGPGTGKTQILSLRIANIIRLTDTAPESILALTFTDSGAQAMRERLRLYLGADAYRVPIYTFHGFAEQLIRRYPDAYERVVGGSPLTELEKLQGMEQILASQPFRYLRPIGQSSWYIKPVLHILSDLKREYINPDGLAAIIARQETELAQTPKIHEKGAHKGKVRGAYTELEKTVAKNQELLTVYRMYEAWLRETNRYDFDDMITETVAAMQRDEGMLRMLQESYQYVLADEHQDVNQSQNQILLHLCSYHSQPNIFVVGDEKQAIYRFQGASLENFLYFENHFPGTTVIQLTENYRSGQDILDTTQAVIEIDDPLVADLRVPLKAALVEKSLVTQRVFTHSLLEDMWVAKEVAQCLERGVAPAEIAIIVRTNREVEALAAQLRQKNIPVTASAEGDIHTHPVTQMLRALITTISKPQDETALAKVLHGSYWGISRDDLVRVLAARHYQQTLWEVVSNQEVLQQAQVANIPAVQRVAEVLERARVDSGRISPLRVIEQLVLNSGFLQYVNQSNPLEGSRIIRRFYDEIESLIRSGEATSVKDIAQALLIHDQYAIGLRAPFITTATNAVQVMTAHRSKGLEFTVVFVPHLTDNAWGGSSQRSTFKIPLNKTSGSVDQVDDDRRLLYVAMTRAKEFLYLSHAANTIDGKERSGTRLLVERMEGLPLKVESTSDFEKSVDMTDTILPMITDTQIDAEVVLTILSERGLSATSFNNYQKNFWTYFYRNIVRIPEVAPLHMQFGTAVHNVLEKVVAMYDSTKKSPSDTLIKELIDQSLSTLPVTTEEFTQLHEKAFTALCQYIPPMIDLLSTAQHSQVELSVRVLLPVADSSLAELPLTGKIDRIDYRPDGSILRVVDYKTGKPKTRNTIIGNTKAGDASYLQQLRFYALLLSLRGEHHEEIDYTLSFVEPGTNGRIVEESFRVTEEEINSLQKEIEDFVGSISRGDVFRTACNPDECDYCDWLEL